MIDRQKINITKDTDWGNQPNNSSAEETRFSDPRVDPSKEFELHLRHFQKPYQNVRVSKGKPFLLQTFWLSTLLVYILAKIEPGMAHYMQTSNQNVWENLTLKSSMDQENLDFNSIVVIKDTSDSLKASQKVFLAHLGKIFP